MADAKIITYGEPFSATTDVVPDGQTAALHIESSDGKDFLQADTSNEKLYLFGSTEADGKVIINRLQSSGNETYGLNVDGGMRVEHSSADGILTFLNTMMFAETDEIVLRLDSTAADKRFELQNSSQNALLFVTADGRISTGGETTSMASIGGLHLKIANSGLANPNSGFDDFVIENNGNTGITFSTPGNAGIRFHETGTDSNHHGITYDAGTNSIRVRCGDTDRFRVEDSGVVKFNQCGVQYFAGTGADDAATEPVYLDDSGATLKIDCRKGNYGDVTLTANVTAVEFLYRPDDGRVFTVTAKITQHGSSAKTIDYSDSAVTVYAGDGTGSASTGEMKWAGGVHHTMSTGTGDVDIVQFTIFPNGTTFDVFAAVIGQDFS
tara:strand:+ start:35 stop:1177 length:1143 start_codon:yes stop_codon:yes gene_type:complete